MASITVTYHGVGERPIRADSGQRDEHSWLTLNIGGDDLTIFMEYERATRIAQAINSACAPPRETFDIDLPEHEAVHV